MSSRRLGSFAIASALVLAVVPGMRDEAFSALFDPAYVRHVRVLRPDGSPALGAVVTALVRRRGDETGTYTPYVFVADGAGAVTIAIPPDDAVIASQPGEHLFNVEATVENGGPGVATRQYVLPYLLNTGDPTWPTDPTGAENTVVRLERVPSPELPGANSGGHPPDYYDCWWAGYPYATPPPAWTCLTTTWPHGLEAVPVPVAPNFGAGADMRTAVRYQDSKSTITSTNVGVDGVFFEVRNAATFGTNSAVSGGIAVEGVPGGTPDETLRIGAQLKVDLVVTCSAEPSPSRCHDHTGVGPDHMIGNLTTSDGASFHDTMKTGGVLNPDCGIYIDPRSHWDQSHGTTRDLAYTAGFDLNGEVAHLNFHASTTYTAYTQDVATTSYSWSVEARTLPYHYLFVPGGNRGYDPNRPQGGAMCPYNDPGGTYTDASTDDCKSADGPCAPVATGGVPDPEEVQEVVQRCKEAPERCGRE